MSFSELKYKLRDLEVTPGLVLAPMSGVTCSAFRRLIKRLNPGSVGLVISEFISVEGLTRDSARSLAMLRFHAEERPVGIQIFGYDIARMCDAARMVQDTGVDVIDINCGCPAPKVVKKGGGCELMRQPEHLAPLLAGLRAAVKIPLTMKFRSGWDENSKNAVQIAKLAEAEGIEALAVHGRTRAQLYRGQADWEVVRAVAESVSIPVLGSGDVVDHGSALDRIGGRVAGLLIGRGAMSNPFVFDEILSGAVDSRRRNSQLVLDVLDLYIELLTEDFPEKVVVGKVKQLASQMCRGQPWRKTLLRVINFTDLKQVLNEARQIQAGPESVFLGPENAGTDESPGLGGRQLSQIEELSEVSI